MSTFLAGHARQCITPETPVHMLGYMKRKEKSAGLHDDLYMNAIALSDGTTKAILLAYDVCMIAEQEMGILKSSVEKATGIPVDHVIINCSHTHSGPQVDSRSGHLVPFEAEYFAGLVEQTAQTAAKTVADMKPARFEAGSAPLDIGGNRRQMTTEGMKLGANPDGPRMAEVTVWRFDRDDAADIVLWSAANHGTTLGGDNLLLSAEWMGDAVKKIEAARGNVRAVFMQGCCGDQNVHRLKDVETLFDAVAAHGTSASESVLRALESMRPLNPTPLLASCVAAPLPTADGGNSPCMIAGLRIGQGVLIGIGGEPFVEYALHTRNRAQAESVMALGYTDGYVSYIPTEQAYSEGGYELIAWTKQQGCKEWHPTMEHALKEAIDRMLDDLQVLKQPASAGVR